MGRSRQRAGRSRERAGEVRPEAVESRREAADELVARGVGYPEELPITERRDDLLDAIRDHQVIVVAGETGSGKSTQLPKLCLEAGRGVRGMIGHTQPRRVAARTIARRVADELGVRVGGEVGSSVRFEDQVGDRTLVRVMTDGLLLADIQRDPRLMRYDTIIVDEAHERSLNIDFVLGYLRQLLPSRPDLKVIVTSATIDTERFAAHFADADGAPAPVVTVSGRTYPVEVRYRPFGDDVREVPRAEADRPDPAVDPGGADDPEATEDPNRAGRIGYDQVDAIVAACEELADPARGGGDGDVLVFLSGEREIHDTADAIRALRWPDTEVVPLYARLSSVEQQRVFAPHRGRRIVLSTNVAETSITVPGVRYVVDAGTARISRYSRRLKVQRLPIEAVSRASADQRAGRCGRVAPGICIRLYSEADYASRPEFTEPEILRTNLASVILQMASIGLGDLASFPFVEPPDRRTVRDGERLLEELGAISIGRPSGAPVRLTKLGRRLARLPTDPRLARMLLEADRLDCVREVLVIVAALSIQDVRERPAEHRERAAGLHQRFRVAGSDLLSIVELWDHLRDRQRALSGNAFRRMCRDEFLHVLRVREWMDLHRQLRRVASDMGIRSRTERAHPDHVHRAVLAGLLSHVGMREDPPAVRDAPRNGRPPRPVFRGARQAEFVIAPGSVLTRRPPRWVMAAELVETDRIYARRVAEIDPTWAERVGAHLVSRSYGEPRWDVGAGRAVVGEQVTLYGLPLVTDRIVGLDRVDADLARAWFIQRALVDGEVPESWLDRHPVLAANATVRERLGSLADRTRRLELLGPDDVFRFYDERIGDDVTSRERFDRWRRTDGAEIDLDLDDDAVRALVGEHGVDSGAYPDTWRQGGVELPITYRFAPGEPLDGVTVHVPLSVLNRVADDGFDWQIPGRRVELVDQLIRSLPKSIRRGLIPIEETIDDVLGVLADELSVPAPTGRGRLTDRVAAAIRSVRGVETSPADFDVDALPADLRIGFVVSEGEGEATEVHAVGSDLTAIKRQLVGATRAAVAAAAPIEERRGITSWDLGDLPRSVESAGVVAFPTLLDVGDSVALRVVTEPEVQERAMRGGVRRLLLLDGAPIRRDVERLITTPGHLALSRADIGVAALVDDCIAAAVDELMDEHGSLPWTADEFAALRRLVRAKGSNRAGRALAGAVAVVVAASGVAERLARLRAPSARATVDDANAHLGRLVRPGFVSAVGVARLGDVERYVRGIAHRLDHLAGGLERDAVRMAEVVPLETRFARLVDGRAPGDLPAEVGALRWDLEELRVQVFAQPVGVHGDVSPKKLRRRLAAAESAVATTP